MYYKKSEQLMDQIGFTVCSSDSIRRADSRGNVTRIDRLFLDNSDKNAEVFRVGHFYYRNVIEVYDDGRTIINTPLTMEESYRIKNENYSFLDDVESVLDGLKRGEYLENQWDNDFLKGDGKYYAKMRSIEMFKDLFTLLIDGHIFICCDLKIGDAELTGANGLLISEIGDVIKKLVSCIRVIREVLFIY